MKGGRIYIICMSVAVVLLFLLQLRLPRNFTWQATFSSEDTNPFGAYVFDSVFSTVMPDYKAIDRTFAEIADDRTVTGVLAVSNDFSLDSGDVEAMKKILRRGGVVMMAGSPDSSTDSLLSVSFGMSPHSYCNFDLNAMRREFLYGKDTLVWVAPNGPYGGCSYCYYSMLNNGQVTVEDSVRSDVDVLVICKDSWSGNNVIVTDVDTVATNELELEEIQPMNIAVSRRVGKGELIFVSVPMLFTNFGVLDPSASGLLFRLMSQFGDMPVVRTLKYVATAGRYDDGRSPLRYFISQKPLREALYIGLLLILVFMVSSMRRRQRVIPVVEPPRNNTLEFAQLIGTLYYQRKNHTDLVRKKYLFFAEELRNALSVDVASAHGDSRTFAVIAAATGLPVPEVSAKLRSLRLCCNSGLPIDNKQMKFHIDFMNMILNRL